MKIARLAAALLLIAHLGLPAMANENKQFTSFELGLIFLDPKGLTGSADQSLNQLFGFSGTILNQMPSGTQAAAKPLSDSIVGLKQQVLGVASTHADKLHPYLEPYQVLEKSPLSYEQLNLPGKANLRKLVEDSNDLLKQTWRITGTIKLSDELLPKLKADVAKIKGADPIQKACLGIVAVSLANLNLSATQAAAKIKPELDSIRGRVETELNQTRAAIQSNPMNAMSMGEDVAVLTSLSSALGNATTEVIGAGPKLAPIASSLQGIITELRG